MNLTLLPKFDFYVLSIFWPSTHAQNAHLPEIVVPKFKTNPLDYGTEWFWIFWTVQLYLTLWFLYSDAETMTSALLLRGVAEEDRFFNQVILRMSCTVSQLLKGDWQHEMNWMLIMSSGKHVLTTLSQILERAEAEMKIMAIRGNRMSLSKLLSLISTLYSKKVI